MTPYDPHRWTSHLFDVEGSMVREILGRVSACVLWSVLIVVLYQYGPDWFDNLAIAETAHALIGASMGLLLVFRTNASYDRFWEGRKLWGSIVNESRNLARQSATWLAADRELAQRAIWWTVAFAYGTMHRLRGVSDIGAAKNHLSAAAVSEVLSMGHVPLAVSRRLTELVASARDRRLIDGDQLRCLDQNVQLLIDCCGACERIRSTPLPFAYAVHLRRALIVYCFTLPLALVQEYGWETVPVTLMIAYVLFGIEEIGVEIEDPFGSDVNDLPLETICESIEQNLREVADSVA
ncbi:MAG: bestrophin family protein [Planctomycetota bacterium]